MAGVGASSQHLIVFAAVVACLLGSVYWLFVASDRYVSQAHVVVQRTDLPSVQGADILGGLLGGSAPGRADQLLLRSHLTSVDMLRLIDASINLRAHYGSDKVDFLSRMWWKDAPLEWLHRHFRNRTSVEFDEYTGVLTIEVQAYDPGTAHAISTFLVQRGERFMNVMANQLAQAQVAFLQGQVTQMHERAIKARQTVLSFQDSKGLISPAGTAEAIAGVVSRLEAQKSELQTQRATLQSYLVADHPNVVMLTQQLAAVEQQIATERARLAAPGGKTLNRTVEQYQRLEAEASFAQDMYKAALSALEKGQVEAHRMVKKVSVLQAPTRPEYAVAPQRLYNTALFILVALMTAGILQLLLAIVRDHKD